MKKHTYNSLVLVLLLSIFSCSDSEKFDIEKGKVGHLTTKTTIKELSEIFKNDSIVSNLSEGALGDNYFQDDDEYLIYNKLGKHLLTIVPKEQLDTTSTIKSIQLNVTIAIDKQELGLKAFSNQKVTLEQIPDIAKMKSFIVWFN